MTSAVIFRVLFFPLLQTFHIRPQVFPSYYCPYQATGLSFLLLSISGQRSLFMNTFHIRVKVFPSYYCPYQGKGLSFLLLSISGQRSLFMTTFHIRAKVFPSYYCPFLDKLTATLINTYKVGDLIATFIIHSASQTVSQPDAADTWSNRPFHEWTTLLGLRMT